MLLAGCGERPIRDLGDVVDASAAPDVIVLDAPALDATFVDAGPPTCRDASLGAVPTTLTAAGLCTARSTGRWCDGDVVRTCGTQRGEVAPARWPCGEGERCVMRGERGACERVGVCRTGATRCASGARIARCVGGAWVESACAARCVGDDLGAACVDPGATRALRGTLRYTRRVIAANLLSWGETVERPARGFALRYRRGDEVLARGVTDAQGAYSLEVPMTAAPGDALEAVAAYGAEGSVVMMVGDPGLAAGSYQAYGDDTSGGAPWTWRFDVPADDAALTIALEASPGASVFDDLRGGVEAVRGRFEAPGRYALAVWVKRGVAWDCGACFSELVPVTAAGQRFDGQLWLTGDAHENFWSPAVTLHELGHWVMSAWGTIPHEGGAHYLGVPGFPGLGWSEGWASWVSSELRDDPRHYAVAGGTFFWWDIARREIFNGARWQRPNPDASPLQLIDENEVSAILWSLRGDPEAGAGRVYSAMGSPRVTLAPFAGCNTQMYFAMGGGTCTSGERAPHLADLLDALRCAGVSERAVRVAAGTYPYAADAPRCEVGCASSACPATPSCSVRAPMSLRANEIGDAVLEVSLTQPGDLGAPATVRLELPPGVTRVDGPTSWRVAAHTDRRERVTLRAQSPRAVTVAVVAEAQSGWAGARATALWTGVVPGGNLPSSPARGAFSTP